LTCKQRAADCTDLSRVTALRIANVLDRAAAASRTPRLQARATAGLGIASYQSGHKTRAAASI
jgi:hypothetical protein